MLRYLSILLSVLVLSCPASAEEEPAFRSLHDLEGTRVQRPSGSKSLRLDEFLELGLIQNPTMAIAMQQVEQARAAYDQQRSQKNPKLALNNSTTLQPEQSISTGGLLAGRPRPANFPERFILVDPLSSQLNVSLQVLLTTFGKVENAIAASFLQIEVQNASAEIEALNLTYQLKEAFFQKLKADAKVDNARINLKVAQQNLEDSTALFEQGVMSRYDILQAEIELTRSVERLAQDLTAVDQASAAIGNVLAERRFHVQPIAPEEVEVSSDIVLDDLEQFALLHRPEFKSLAFSRDVAQKLLDAAYSQNNPELVLAANYSTVFGQSLMPGNIPSLTLQLQWQIFDGGFRKGKIREAKSVLVSIDASVVQIENQVLAQVEQLWLALEQTEYNLNTAKKQVENTEEYFEMARQRYINGLATTLEVSDSFRNLVTARSRLVETIYDRELAFSRLEQALGANVTDRKLTPEFLKRSVEDSAVQGAQIPSENPLDTHLPEEKPQP